MIRIIISILLSSFLTVYSNAQTSIKMQKKGGVYTIPCKVNELPLKFIFDTGASDVSISMSEAIFMIKNGYLTEKDIKGSEFYSIANGEIQEGTTINLNVVEISGLKLYNVKASIVHSLEAPLLLGQSALQKLGRIEFDYGSEKLVVFEENDSALEKRRNLETETTYHLDSLYSENAILYYDKAVAEWEQGDFKEAINLFDKVIEIEDSYLLAYINRGLANILLVKDINPLKPLSYDYDREQMYKTELNEVFQHCQMAFGDADKVLSIDPDNVGAFYVKGRAKMVLKDYTGAVLEFSKALQFDKESKNSDKNFLLRAKAYYELNKYSKTIKDCSSCIEVSDSRNLIGEAYYYKALCREDLYGTKYALEDFSKAGEFGYKKAYEAIGEREYKWKHPYKRFFDSITGGIIIISAIFLVLMTFTILLIRKIRKNRRRKKAHNNG